MKWLLVSLLAPIAACGSEATWRLEEATIDAGLPDLGSTEPADAGRAPDAASPPQRPSNDPIVEVRVGDLGPCTRTAWGRVECGPGLLEEPREPRVAIESGARALSVGGTYAWHLEKIACVLMDGGVVRCASDGRAGGSSFESFDLAIDATEVSVGRDGACAIDVDGRVLCWPTFYYEPHQPRVVDLRGASAVACSTFRCCGLDHRGDAWCWGENGGSAERVPLNTSTGFVRASEALVCVITPDRRAQCIDQLGEQSDDDVGAIDLDVWGSTVCWLDTTGRVGCRTRGRYTDAELGPVVQIDVGHTNAECSNGGECPIVCGVTDAHQVLCAEADPFHY